MNIVVFKETSEFEKRVAVTPEITKKYTDLNISVFIEKNLGKDAGFTDEEFINSGASIFTNNDNMNNDVNIVLTVSNIPEIKTYFGHSSSIYLIGLLSPYENKNLLKNFNSSNLNCLSMELIPRISRAQSMDVLSSQSNLVGYKAVINSAAMIKQAIPMMMTAAGTIIPAKILILGAGVAGLQAIATAKRLGSVVYAFDVRPEVEEQVLSLGAKFISVNKDEESSKELSDGYAKEMDDDYKIKQLSKIEEIAKISDIIITTALIPGKKAPILIPKSTVNKMKKGSIVYDLAGIAGGNCELTEFGRSVISNGVTISSPVNLPSEVAKDASNLYSKNLFTLVKLLLDKNNQVYHNMSDEIICDSTIIKDGKFVNKILEEK